MKDTENLRSQGFKNATQVLAVVLNESITSFKEDENRIREIESTKADTSLLALDDGYMQVCTCIFVKRTYKRREKGG